ncbi:MAG: hypothetical protein P1V19_11135, partial [Gimesia sp.]|nr:hypothetical protein [Gimesia sp.]
MRTKQKLFDRYRYFSINIQAKLRQWWRRSSFPERSCAAVKQKWRPLAYQVELLEDRTMLAAGFSEFVDPNPSTDNGFGDTVVALSTGNVVITSPYDDAGGADAGAVYLFDGATRELISTLTGSTANDNVGRDGVTVLSNGNYVVRSSEW